MEKGVFLRAVNVFLTQCGISLSDLAQAEKTENETGILSRERQISKSVEFGILSDVVFDSDGNFLFDVLYDGGIRSKQFLSDRKPLGVVWGDYVISLKNSSIPMSWDEAVRFCDNRKMNGLGMEPGDIEFWKSFINKKPLTLLNALFEYLGGEPMLQGCWYWTSSLAGCSGGYGMAFCLLAEETIMRFNGYCSYSADDFERPNYVRPVLSVLKL